jgi:putative membrane protein
VRWRIAPAFIFAWSGAMVGFKSVAIAAGLAAAFVMGQSRSQGTDQASASLPEADHKFLNYAAEDNQAEIQLCLIAEKRAGDPAIKAFARLMVDDHVEIESRLAALGNQLKSDLPDGIGKDGQQTEAKLQPLQGSQFEAEFMQAQIKDHSDDLQKFKQEAQSTQNDRIRQFATETIPILEQHPALARAVEGQLHQTSGRAGSH